ncbi:GNAT family protein [Gorillibacterium sp. CAU 1737]|uniref:GNAT family N-acetyltransferase n=1 Tax=Gorillibacterium sp. CAU 1737 TaxID=3140362 RepID=UPI0032607F5A
MIRDEELIIRPVEKRDLRRVWEMTDAQAAPEWKKWDAPYYEHVQTTYEDFLADPANAPGRESLWVIEVSGLVVGFVSYYWEHKPSWWLEMGILLFEPAYWSGGYGTRALKLWIGHLFETMPLVRVGFTTWSGNHRMIRVGEKLGMTMEARLRKCRYYDGVYYDSIRMGLLREEWEAPQTNR